MTLTKKKKNCKNPNHKLIFKKGTYSVYECVNAKEEIYYTVAHKDKVLAIDVHRHYQHKQQAISIAVKASKSYIPYGMAEYFANDIEYLITGIKPEKRREASGKQ